MAIIAVLTQLHQNLKFIKTWAFIVPLPILVDFVARLIQLLVLVLVVLSDSSSIKVGALKGTKNKTSSSSSFILVVVLAYSGFTDIDVE